ncbi:MAG: flagellar export chaperone FlgN [Acidimicrobiales bacterium]
MPILNDMSMQRLSACLYEEKEALEELLFKLEEEQLILAAGRHRWLPRASVEVENALRILDAMERVRHDVMVSVAEETEVASGEMATLPEVAGAVGEPWSEVLLESAENMRALLVQVAEMVASNRDLIMRGLASTAETLVAIGASAGISYGPDGESRTVAGMTRLLDAAI